MTIMERKRVREMSVNLGLKGVVALESDISRIDGAKGILEYRGYNIHDLAKHSSFEEVTFLLLNGQLPTKAELNTFSEELASRRALSRRINSILYTLPTINYPTVILRTIYSYLGDMDETLFMLNPEENRRKALDLIAKTPTIIAYYQKIKENNPLTPPNKQLGHAANFLWMLTGEEPDQVDEKALDLALVLHAEHTLNASTFAARIAASTLSDIYAGIVSATGTLFGPLHGGASLKVIKMLRELKGKDAQEIEQWVDEKLQKRERIMGFGHRVYKTNDPRAEELQKIAKKLDESKGNNWLAPSRKLAEIVYRKRRLYPNVDFYAASVYANLGIPDDQHINMFVMGRIVGWTIHMLDQYQHNKLIRPLQKYIGTKKRTYIPVDKRDNS
jgi:citrate synthase